MPFGDRVIHGNYLSVCECTSRKTMYEEPIRFRIERESCDYYNVMNMSIISERFYTFLKEHGLSGFRFRNAVVQEWNPFSYKTEKKLEDLKYYEMVVTGRCGLLRNLSSAALPHCKKCGRRLAHTGLYTNGVSFAPEAYDGSDIFAFDNLWNIPIVTEKLRDDIISQGFTNIRFTPLNESIFDDTMLIHLIQKSLNEGRASKDLIEAWLENGIITADMIPDKTVQE